MDRDSLISRLRRSRSIGGEVPQQAVDRALATYRDLMRPARRVALIEVETPAVRHVRGPASEEIRSFQGETYTLELLLRPEPYADAVGQLRIEGSESCAGAAYVVDERGRALASTTLNAFGEFRVERRLPSRFYLVVGGDWLRIDLGGAAAGGE